MKVDEQGYLQSSKFQISQDSSCMNGVQTFHRLQFDNDTIVDEQIQSVTTIELDTLINQRDRFLALDGELAARELVSETGLVCRFEQPWSQFAMHIDRSVDDAAGHIIDIQLRVLRDSAVKNPFEVCPARKPEDMAGPAVLMSR